MLQAETPLTLQSGLSKAWKASPPQAKGLDSWAHCVGVSRAAPTLRPFLLETFTVPALPQKIVMRSSHCLQFGCPLEALTGL